MIFDIRRIQPLRGLQVFDGLSKIARVSQEELKHDLDAGTAVCVVDLRSELDVAAIPFTIPGALRIAAEELERRHHEIPRDRDVIVYCS